MCNAAQNIIRLRPHHLLCIRFFSGHGYSPAFTENMHTIVRELKAGARVKIVFGMDDICASCPNAVPCVSCQGEDGEAVCVSEEKVLRYDASVIARLLAANFDCDKSHTWQAISETVEYAILRTGHFSSICPDCAWHDLCRYSV